MMKTPKKKNAFVYDIDTTFTTEKIPKSSTIRIEVWHSKSKKDKASEKDKLILSFEDGVNSFLRRSVRKGAIIHGAENEIDATAFWQDELE